MLVARKGVILTSFGLPARQVDPSGGSASARRWTTGHSTSLAEHPVDFFQVEPALGYPERFSRGKLRGGLWRSTALKLWQAFFEFLSSNLGVPYAICLIAFANVERDYVFPVSGWRLSALLFLDWQVRIRLSRA